jgi:hypothetical protein
MKEPTMIAQDHDLDDPDGDSLEGLHADRLRADPGIDQLVSAARERRAFLTLLADERRRLGISQSVVAKRMGTSQPFVSRFEHALLDPQMSTEDRYAAAIGRQVFRTLVPSRAPQQGDVEAAVPGSGTPE